MCFLSTASFFALLSLCNLVQSDSVSRNEKMQFKPANVFRYKGSIELYRAPVLVYKGTLPQVAWGECILTAFFVPDQGQYSVSLAVGDRVRPLPDPEHYFLYLKKMYEKKKYD
jgi:hypothetical protein